MCSSFWKKDIYVGIRLANFLHLLNPSRIWANLKTTKKEIVELLGSPSTTSNFDNEQSWIYISSEFKKFIFLDGSNTDQKILILSFNQNTLKNKELLSKNDINNIEYEETLTDSRGKKVNWIKDFFSNLNPDPYGKRK